MALRAEGRDIAGPNPKFVLVPDPEGKLVCSAVAADLPLLTLRRIADISAVEGQGPATDDLVESVGAEQPPGVAPVAAGLP